MWEHELREPTTEGTSDSRGMGKIQAKRIPRLAPAPHGGRFLWLPAVGLGNALVLGQRVH